MVLRSFFVNVDTGAASREDRLFAIGGTCRLKQGRQVCAIAQMLTVL
jgi:hypothetical protein